MCLNSHTIYIFIETQMLSSIPSTSRQVQAMFTCILDVNTYKAIGQFEIEKATLDVNKTARHSVHCLMIEK